MNRRTFTKTSLLALLALGTGATSSVGLRTAVASPLAPGACPRLGFRAETEASGGVIVLRVYAENSGDFPIQYEAEIGEGLVNRVRASLDAGGTVTPLDFTDPNLVFVPTWSRIPPGPILVHLPPGSETLLLVADADYDVASVPSGAATLRVSVPLAVSPAFSGRLPAYEGCPIELAVEVEIPAAG
jgi:hypothetical protein